MKALLAIVFLSSLLANMLLVHPVGAQSELEKARLRLGTFVTEVGVKNNSIQEIIFNAIRWLLSLVAAVTLAVLIWGGFTYTVSLGDEERAKRAKRVILYAIIGVLLIAASFLILEILRSLLVPAP